MFPGRLTVIDGDSADTVPAYASQGVDKCDLVMVDVRCAPVP